MQRRFSLLLVVAVALGTAALGACGDDDEANDDVFVAPVESAAEAVSAFAEVQASAMVFEADPQNAERAIFHVTTTEPMICAIIWGETEAFGNFNNSLAMSGTGLAEHDVYLPGAVAGRTYYYQVQGSTADGRLYRSPTATFTIEAADQPAGGPATTIDAGTNLAEGAAVSDVSSEFNDAFASANAIDGSGTSEWSSAGDGDDAFITVDLGASEEITGVEFVTRSMLDGTAIAETFTVTIDGGEPRGPFPASTPVDRQVAAVQATGQLVRFDVEASTGGNVGAVEVAVYG